MERFIGLLRRIDGFSSRASRVITAVAIAIQTIIMFLGVIFRYFLNSPLTWSDETATFLLVFITFFGCYVALKDRILARIEIIVERLPAIHRKIVVLASNLMVLTLLVAVIYFGAVLGMSPVIMLQKTPALELPFVWFYAVIPVTALFMFVHILVQTYDGLLREDRRTT